MTAPPPQKAKSATARDPLGAWQTIPSSGDQFDCLDGLRGIAILLVVACHTIYANPSGPEFLKLIAHVVGMGAMGVQVFFALSGFVISYPFFLRKAEKRSDWYPARYLARRFWRIYPPLILSMVFFCVFYWFTKGDALIREAGWWLVGWPHIVPIQMRFNPVIWSLVIEVQFYLVLPVLFWATRRLPYRFASICIFLVLFCAPMLARQLAWSPEASPLQAQLDLRRFPGYLDSFAWGVLFASWFGWARVQGNISVNRARIAAGGWAVLTVGIVAVGVVDFFFEGAFKDHRWSLEVVNALPSVATFLLLHYLWNPRLPGAHFLGHPALRWFGLISYEWYLFHQPIIYWFREVAGSAGGNLLRYLGTLSIPVLGTLLFGALVYRFFSLPILRSHRRPKTSHG